MSRPAFARRRGVDRERVDAAFELTDKCFVDHAVALEPALPAERLRHNIHPEMSLPAPAMSGMPGVLVGFVHHLEARGSESLGQLLRDEIAPCHGVRIAGARPVGQCRPRPEMTPPIFISSPSATGRLVPEQGVSFLGNRDRVPTDFCNTAAVLVLRTAERRSRVAYREAGGGAWPVGSVGTDFPPGRGSTRGLYLQAHACARRRLLRAVTTMECRASSASVTADTTPACSCTPSI